MATEALPEAIFHFEGAPQNLNRFQPIVSCEHRFATMSVEISIVMPCVKGGVKPGHWGGVKPGQ